MERIYIQDTIDMLDIEKIEEYNREFIRIYPNWKPFVTKNNFIEYLKSMKNRRQGIGNSGIKEIFYWFIEEGKIIGSGSIRQNPEDDKMTEIYSGHIFYQIIPSKRRQGYGTLLCHLLIEKMYELGYKEALITCDDTNIGSRKVIENNGGKFIEIIQGDSSTPNSQDKHTRRYKFDIEKSLSEFKKDFQKRK